MTKQHSQNTRQAVNTAATLYPPPVPRGGGGGGGLPSVHSKGFAPSAHPIYTSLFFCKPHPGFLGGSKMLTVTFLQA